MWLLVSLSEQTSLSNTKCILYGCKQPTGNQSFIIILKQNPSTDGFFENECCPTTMAVNEIFMYYVLGVLLSLLCFCDDVDCVCFVGGTDSLQARLETLHHLHHHRESCSIKYCWYESDLPLASVLTPPPYCTHSSCLALTFVFWFSHS